jgi:hypothetical protein
LDDVRDVMVGTETTQGIRLGETEHINDGVEAFGLDRPLEPCPILPISPQQSGPARDFAMYTAIETDDVMALIEQSAHNTRTDMTCTTHDTHLHTLTTPGLLAVWSPCNVSIVSR